MRTGNVLSAGIGRTVSNRAWRGVWHLAAFCDGRSWARRGEVLSVRARALSVRARAAGAAGVQRLSALRLQHAWLTSGGRALGERHAALSSRCGQALSIAAGRVRASRALCNAFGGLSSAAGVLGVFIAGLTPLRVAASLVVLLSCSWLVVSGYEPPPDLALAFFGLAFALRYGFLFTSFTPNGVAARLTARYGAARGFSIYEAVTVLSTFAQRLAFVWVLVASYGEASGSIGSALMSLGCFLVALGAVMSVWAVQTAGLEAYYYADLFHGTTASVLTQGGPYATFRNPMYGVGRFTAYGFALIAVSPVGLIIAALDQLALYAFNEFVEQPCVRHAGRFLQSAPLQSESLAQASAVPVVAAVPYAQPSQAADGTLTSQA